MQRPRYFSYLNITWKQELYASAKEANKKKKTKRTGDGGNDKSRDTTPHSQANDEDSTIPSETSTKNARARPSKRKIDEVIDNEKDAGHNAEVGNIF